MLCQRRMKTEETGSTQACPLQNTQEQKAVLMQGYCLPDDIKGKHVQRIEFEHSETAQCFLSASMNTVQEQQQTRRMLTFTRLYVFRNCMTPCSRTYCRCFADSSHDKGLPTTFNNPMPQRACCARRLSTVTRPSNTLGIVLI